MKWLRQHKWTLIISVLLFLGIKTLPKLLFLSDPLRQNRHPNPDCAADGSAQQRVWRRQSGAD